MTNWTQRVDDETFVSLTYPSDSFRPIPAFTIDVPADWVVTEFADALFAMGPKATTGAPWSNVIVRHQRVFPSVTLEEIAQVNWNHLKAAHPDLVLKQDGMVQLAEVHYVRETELTIESEPGPVSRVDSFVFGRVVDHPTVDLFHFTWMNPASADDFVKDVYQRILLSFHFE